MEDNFLIDHWSYSSLSLFLRNKLAFKKKYIQKIYDDQYTPSAIVGQAAHKALETYFNGSDVNEAIGEGLKHIDTFSDVGINYGKTGSREKIIKTYTQAINFYFSELQINRDVVLGVEKKITTFIEIIGQKMALPAKSFSDLVVEKDGELEIIDHKFLTSYTDDTEDNPSYIVQALFNFHTVRAEYGKDPKRMIFNECKISKNTDGKPQIQPYVIEFEKHPEYFTFFLNLYNDCTREIMRPDILFLPNFQDYFDGKNTYEAYRDNLISVDPPIVSHKTKQVEFEEKNYIESAPDKVENAYITDEEKIRLKLQEFGLPVEMKETFRGSSITLYTFKPSRGLKMSQFDKVAKDIALALKAKTIRVEAPIMGTDCVGVEVPNKERVMVHFLNEDGEVNPLTQIEAGTMKIPIGVNVYGETITKDLSEMPHLLVAGATGSGKSVMLNVIIRSLIETNDPERLKLILIDPKRVELSQYKNSPFLLAPVIFDDDKATKALRWLIAEMEDRYSQLEQSGCRSIDIYNEINVAKMTKIVVVIDEFADLMLQRGKGDTAIAEACIIRLAQKARAVGIHIILGTQRPSVDVVTGLIKANLPTRIAFMTSSRIDSQVILDQAGAEELAGKGDMLFQDPSHRGLQRLQGFYI